MRIALVTNLYPPIQTGTAYYTHALARAMSGLGHEVMVVTCRAGGETVDSSEGGVRVKRLAALRVPPNRAMLNFDDFKLAARPGLVSRLAALLVEHRAEVVQQCGHLLDFTYATPRAAHCVSIPSACSVHAMIGLPGRPRLDAIARAVDRWFVGPQAMRRYDAVLPLDRTMDRYVRDRYGVERVVGAPWGIEFDFERRERIHLGTKGPLRIVSLGHVTEMRSRTTLLQAVAELRARGVEVKLRIVGKECTLTTRELAGTLGIADAVIFTGELPREEALAELAHADVQANWITNPGVGSGAMESMAMGVATMLWAQPDQLGFAALEHLDNALLIDPADPSAIADALAMLAGDRQLLDRIGARARETARAGFGWGAAAERMQHIYRTLIERHAGAPLGVRRS